MFRVPILYGGRDTRIVLVETFGQLANSNRIFVQSRDICYHTDMLVNMAFYLVGPVEKLLGAHG